VASCFAVSTCISSFEQNEMYVSNSSLFYLCSRWHCCTWGSFHWILESSGTLHYVRPTIPVISKNHNAFVFRVKQTYFFMHCLSLKMKAFWSFKTSGTITSTQHNIPEDLNLQKHCCENLKSCKFVIDCDFRFSWWWLQKLLSCCMWCCIIWEMGVAFLPHKIASHPVFFF
jgi:hypothetical protein